ERHVVVTAGYRAVVCDDGNALRLGLIDDCRACTLVVDDEHDAAALGELLVGDRGHLVGAALSVLDVSLEAGVLERLLERGAVAVLPAVRRLRVGQDDAGTRGGGASVVVASAVVGRGTSGKNQRGSAGECSERNQR